MDSPSMAARIAAKPLLAAMPREALWPRTPTMTPMSIDRRVIRRMM
jgi:hypothetical protein